MPVKASDQRSAARWARASDGARGRDAFGLWPARVAREHSDDPRARHGDENEPAGEEEEEEEVATSSPGQQLSNIQIPPPVPAPAPAPAPVPVFIPIPASVPVPASAPVSVPVPAARQQVDGEAREISTINGPISVGHRKAHNKRSKPPTRSPGDEPLIHTDQLSASSPTLYVYAPSYAGAQMGQARLAPAPGSRGAELVAESSPRAAVLAAVYEPPREPLVVRLAVVNLEVASDTATLTWTLGLYPGEQVKQPGAAGKASLLAGARRGQESESGIERDGESKGGDNDFAANISRPGLKANDKRASGVPAAAAAPEHLNKAPIVKRDTMLAPPTLNWRNSTTGNEINQDKDKRARPSGAQKRPRSLLTIAPAAANGEESDPPARAQLAAALAPPRDDDAPASEAREEHKEQDDLGGQPAALGPPALAQESAGPGAAGKPSRDSKAGQQQQRSPKVVPSRSLDQLAGRFQLTRLQALAPNPTVNRRPPARGQPQSLSTPPAAHPEAAGEVEPEKAISAKAQEENYPADSRRPLRAIASRTPAAASGQLRGPTEPPMIRAPIVPLNRLSGTLVASSTTTTTTTTTTQRPRATSGARSGKNLGELSRLPSSPTSPASGQQEDEPNGIGTSYYNPATKVLPAGHAHSTADSPAVVTPTSGPTKSTSTGRPSSPVARSSGDEVSPPSVSEPTTKSVSRIEPPIESNKSPALERPVTPPPAAPAASSTRRPEVTPTPRAASSRLPAPSSAPESLEVEGISTQTRDAAVIARLPVVVPPPPPLPQLPNESKWLIRLRRFASNEVDIVKIVVNNLSQSILKQMQLTTRAMEEENGAAKEESQPLMRYVSFKNLEPASAYEICVESASPDQEVGDRFQILDANHFLKCHDSSQTELTNSSTTTTTTTSGSSRGQTASDGAALHRHLVRRMEDQTGGSEHLISSSGADWPPDEKREELLELTGDVNEPSAVKRKRAAPPPDSAGGAEELQADASKLKSLCKEFFTLPAHSNERISFGQGAWPTGQPQRQQRPTAFVSLAPGQGSSALNSSGTGPRRPKSLNSALKSRMELLEIHDLLAPGSPESRTFEMVASGGGHLASPGAGEQPQGRPLSSTAASEHSPSIHQLPLPGGQPGSGTTPTSVGHGRAGTLEGAGGGRSGEPALANSNGNYMVGAHSMLPIVACIFGLIFIITLANLLLNSISCRPAGRSRRMRARRHQLSGANLGSCSPGANLGRSAAHLGSFYSDQSDQSGGGGSQTRIVVVGKHNGLAEPFANASAYFEVPVDRRSASLEPGAGAGGGGGGGGAGSSGPGSSAGRHSSSYLLAANSAAAAAASARFPLGPSFEGDERHNADMVGLARKNYDDFIHRIYNHTNGEQMADEQMGAKERQEQCPTHRHKNPAPLVNARGHSGASRQHRRSTACVISQHLPGAAEQLSANSGAASSPECGRAAGRQDSTGQGRKQRIRFDKINPIYNMEGLYLTGSTSVGASVSSGGGARQRSKRSSGVSTFGRLNAPSNAANNAPLIAEEEAPRSASSSLSGASSASERGGQAARVRAGAESAQDEEEQCPLCSPRAQQSSCCQSSPASGAQANGAPCTQECSGACQAYSIGAETVNGVSSLEPESGEPYFTCCLDKQKQRFHAQQQQLERVLTKTGSLLPQPFINPSGPARCSSPACQSVVRDHEQVSAAAVQSTKGEQSLGSEQALLLDAGDSLGQLDKGDQEMIDMEAVVSSYAAPSGGAKSNQQLRNSAESQGDFYAFRPQTPPPPPPPIESPEPGQGEGETQVSSSPSTPVSSDSEKKDPGGESQCASSGRERKKKCTEPTGRQSTNSNTSPAKVSLKLGSMGSGELGEDKRKSETINKTDFNQRRNELASKLHLSGMINPPKA